MVKKDLKLILFFISFIFGGVSGIFFFDFSTDEIALRKTYEWLLIPIFSMGLIYAYKSTFGYDNSKPFWKNLVGMLVMTLISSMLFFISFQGYLTWINCTIGEQKDYLLKGEIVELDYPETKKIGNKYSILILRELEQDTIKLSVPTNEYEIGQKFIKSMKVGCFGFIYSD